MSENFWWCNLYLGCEWLEFGRRASVDGWTSKGNCDFGDIRNVGVVANGD